MKKFSKYFILLIAVVIFFAACGSGESADIPTGTPSFSPTPILIEPPVATAVPPVTEVPTVTTTVTEVPSTPSSDLTSTPVPTAIPINAPETSKEYTFDFSQMSCILAHSCSYEIDNEGALMVRYNTQYGQMMFALPEAVDMAQCDRVTVRANVRGSDCSVKNLCHNLFGIISREFYVF